MVDEIDRDGIWIGKHLGGETENFIGLLVVADLMLGRQYPLVVASGLRFGFEAGRPFLLRQPPAL